jgi:hypothetical protein
MHLPEGKINNLLGMINSAIKENSELREKIEEGSSESTEEALQMIAKKVPEVQEAIDQNLSGFERAIDGIGTEPQAAPENPPKTSYSPAAASGVAPAGVPTAAPGTAPIPVDTSASSRGVVGPKSPLDAARDKLDEMMRKGGNDPRATAQLFLLKSQSAKTEHADAFIELVNLISDDPELIANAVEAANEAREEVMRRDISPDIRSERSKIAEGNAKWEETFLNEIGDLPRLDEEEKPLHDKLERLRKEKKDLKNKMGSLLSEIVRNKDNKSLYDDIERSYNELDRLCEDIERSYDETLNSLESLREKNRPLRGEISRLQNENKRPNFKKLVAPKKTQSYVKALVKYVSEIEKTVHDSQNLFRDFPETETAKIALGNPNFDLGTLFEADLISQLGGEHINAIEEMRRNNPEAFKALSVLSALQHEITDSANSYVNHPQFSPDINPVVQKCVGLIRSGGDITDPEVFAELLRREYNDLTGEDL